MKKRSVIYIIKQDVENYYKFATPQFKDKAVEMLWKEFERRRQWRRDGNKYYREQTDRDILAHILIELFNTKHLFAFMVEKELGLI